MTILIIDDEPGLRRSLRAHLEDLDHEVIEAADGAEGLELLKANKNKISAVVVDLNMPVMNGYSFIPQAVKDACEIPIVVLSGVGIVEDALSAMRLGAWDFITKPLHNLDILDYALGKVMERARLLRENRLYQENLEQLVRERTAELEETRHQVMLRLSRAAEFKDNETGHHVLRVGKISRLLGQALGMDEKRTNLLGECAALHDIGKIGIPDEVLLKPGRLTAEEFSIMRRHCAYGCEILGPLGSKDEACTICADPVAVLQARGNELLDLARVLALFHHERWDGMGYPFGLKGIDIPLEARIVSVVDVYDALCSDRPYKSAMTDEAAKKILSEGSGSQFDPDVIKVFFLHSQEIREIRERWKD